MLAILHNPRYLGYQVWGRARKTDVLVDPANVQLGTRPLLIDNPSEDWIWSEDCAQPALVDRETWNKAQAIRSQCSVTAEGHTYLLSGLIRCAHCGKRLKAA
ncbi:recombinase family protein [Catenulispora sp. GAS73]|uniref:recombinase family protein n=1 Tax=Catenulispora sp. GAS73 TaxID=3156269 RepID=UPI003513E2B4